GDPAAPGGEPGGRGLAGQERHAEEVALDEAAAQVGQHAVGVRHPLLHAVDDVDVVEAAEVLADGRVGQHAAVDALAQEEKQGGGAGVCHVGAALGQQVAHAEEDGAQELVAGQDGAVQVDLPVHQPARDDEVLDGVDPLRLDDDVGVRPSGGGVDAQR